MAKILLINPNRWGRGITTIWIPSHVSTLRDGGHSVKMFDCTFYSDWTDNELAYNTNNKQYKHTKYNNFIKFKAGVTEDLQKFLDDFQPDFIFWSALSSHIHGEGEYVNIQYGYDLLQTVKTNAKLVTGGLQVTADPQNVVNLYKNVDYFISGESEFVFRELVDYFDQGDADPKKIKGLIYQQEDGSLVKNPKQDLISNLDAIPPYDYSIFDSQIFYRAYNGDVVKAVDYELSRGCVFTCGYCVETVIQKYYGFEENRRGFLKGASRYLRSKSAERIFSEMQTLYKHYGVQLFRCQDTNFLTIKRTTLEELADLLEKSDLDIKLYIETRADGISDVEIQLLKRLKVDGIGMGIEMAAEDFRQGMLNRFVRTEKLLEVFDKLRAAGIKRTAYNIIGLPEENEQMILDTITFNTMLDPDNITVAFYSPYIGTPQQQKGVELGDFNDNELNVDGQIRSTSRSSHISINLLNYYKENFVRLVREAQKQDKVTNITKDLQLISQDT